MTIEKNEVNQETPEVLDNETKEILDELEQEGHKIAGRPDKSPDTPTPEGDEDTPEDKEDPEKPEDKKEDGEKKTKKETKKDEEEEDEEEDETDEDEEEEDDEEGKPARRQPRTPKYMPAWKHKKEMKQAESSFKKREEELLKEIDSLKTKPSDSQETKDVAEEVKKIVADINENGISADHITQIVKLSSASKADNPELSKLVKRLNELEGTRQDAKEEAEFNSEFDKGVMPLIKKEYPDASESTLASIRKKLHKVAYTEEYARTPLDVIYKGIDDFREVTPAKKKKSGESSRGGEHRKSDVLDYANMTEEQLDNLSPEETDKYFEWVEKNKK